MPPLASLYRRLSLAIARANASFAPDYSRSQPSYMPLRATRAAGADPADGRSTTDDGSSSDDVNPSQSYGDRDDDLKKDALGVRTEEVEPLVGRENLCASSPSRSSLSQSERWPATDRLVSFPSTHPASALPPHVDFWGYEQVR